MAQWSTYRLFRAGGSLFLTVMFTGCGGPWFKGRINTGILNVSLVGVSIS